MKPYPRERFSATVTLTPDAVASYATVVGDTNPLHHDPAFAAETRFGRVIVSGTQTAALLLGLTASHYSRAGAMIGLEFWIRFRRPVCAGDVMRLEWLCVRVTPSDKLRGDIVELRGRITLPNGETAVGAKGKVLVAEQL